MTTKNMVSAIETADTSPICDIKTSHISMVDERFECAAVIFRLAGRPEYSYLETDYHKEIAEYFSDFINHDAVVYAKELPLGYDAVFKFTVHIEKNGNDFQFIENTSFLYDDGRWNEENAGLFLNLFNKFYKDTNYKMFFNSHIKLFEQYTLKFIDNEYSKIDFEWFSKYVEPSNLRCIYSLSSGNYSTTVNDKIIYCLVWGKNAPVIHEFCHSFANPIAEKWYNEDTEFKKWCDETINAEKMPFYNDGLIIANEYLTRAYNILYDVQHGAELDKCLSRERNHLFENSFRYMEEVYGKVFGSRE